MKYSITSALVILAGVILLASPASAQVVSGLNEIGGRGYVESGKFSGEENETTLSLDMFYARFVTTRLAIGPSVSFYKYGDEDASGAYSAFADYHFGDTTARFIPYAGVSVGKFFNDGDNEPTFVAFGPGAKLFFGEGGGALTLAAFYRRQFMDADLNNGASGANEFVFSIGVSGFFGR